jgi:GNAT superfamily N-acetyltransferase
MVRSLTQRDVPAALALSMQAGWNQTARDWKTLLALEPEGCFAIDGDEGIAATATLVCYGQRLAWLGMVLTDAQYRRRGYARSLVRAALEFAAKRGVKTVKLDATDQGKPLYESLRFRGEETIERWSRGRESVRLGPAPVVGSWQGVKRLDQEAFGVSRANLIARLEHSRAYSNEEGFLLARAGSRATYLGPFVAKKRAAAKEMLDAFCQEMEGPAFWDILSSNSAAVALAEEFGFERVRTLQRMARGDGLHQNTGLIYGIAGFEFG